MKVSNLLKMLEDIHYEGAYKVYDNDELVAVFRKSTYPLPVEKFKFTENTLFGELKTSSYKLNKTFGEPTFIIDIGDPDKDTKEIEIRYDFVLERKRKKDSYFLISAESKEGKENSHSVIEFVFYYSDRELASIIKLFLDQYNINKKQIELPKNIKPKVDIE